MIFDLNKQDKQLKVPINWDRESINLIKMIKSNEENLEWSSLYDEENDEIDEEENNINNEETDDIDEENDDIDEEANDINNEDNEVVNNKNYINIINNLTQEEYDNCDIYDINNNKVKIKKYKDEFILLNNDNDIDNIKILGVIKNNKIIFFK